MTLSKSVCQRMVRVTMYHAKGRERARVISVSGHSSSNWVTTLLYCRVGWEVWLDPQVSQQPAWVQQALLVPFLLQPKPGMTQHPQHLPAPALLAMWWTFIRVSLSLLENCVQLNICMTGAWMQHESKSDWKCKWRNVDLVFPLGLEGNA